MKHTRPAKAHEIVLFIILDLAIHFDHIDLFWTKQNLEMVRGLVAAGFTLKARPAEAVGGGARRRVKMSRAKLDT